MASRAVLGLGVRPLAVGAAAAAAARHAHPQVRVPLGTAREAWEG